MKTKLLWLTSISCNGNAHSFLNYPYFEQFLKDFEFIYHPILTSTNSFEDVINDELECDVLILEGAISLEYKKFDEPVINLIDKYATKAKKIVTVGTCATFGGIFKNSGFAHTTGFHFDEDKPIHLFNCMKNKTICISGCPVHPQVLVDVLYSIRNNVKIKLDKFLRPMEYFAYTVHNGCTRNEYFEYKVDNHNFGKKEGCMFYEHGCKAPFTRGSCNKILWNEVNSKTRNGSPCFGCSEPSFPKTNLFKTKKNMGIPENLPLGVAKRVYLTIAGVTKAFKIKRFEEELF
jgi:hydrogenase small subunit